MILNMGFGFRDGGLPEIGIGVRGWILHACKVEGLLPFDAGAAAPAMDIAAFVAGPCLCKGDIQARAFSGDVGFGFIQKRCVEFDV